MDKELELYEESKAEKKYKRKSRRIRRIITASVLLLVMAANIAFTVLADKQCGKRSGHHYEKRWICNALLMLFGSQSVALFFAEK